MKILIITSSYPRSGRIAGLWIPELIRELNELGCNIHVLTQNCESQKAETEDVWSGCRVTYFPWEGGTLPLISVLETGMSGIPLAFQFIANGIHEAVRICREWKPDFLFAEWLIPSGFIAYIVAKRLNIPYAVRTLGSDVVKAEQSILIRSVARVIARNSAVLFADGFDLCKKTSSLGGGNACKFAATGRTLGSTRSRFRLPADNGIFTTCTVGRLHHVKGQDVLVDASEILSNKSLLFRCYIVGEGPESGQLQQKIDKAGLGDRVFLTGRLEDGDVTELLRLANCVVIPSRSESIPLSFGEAVSAKKPLIVTDVGDLSYLVKKYGLGYVVPPDDTVALADALERMIRLPGNHAFAEEKNYWELETMFGSEGAARTIYQSILDCQKARLG